MDLRTNSDFRVRIKRLFWYNRDGDCLLRGTRCVLICIKQTGFVFKDLRASLLALNLTNINTCYLRVKQLCKTRIEVLIEVKHYVDVLGS
jgi:hypothetical protein